MYRLEPDKVAFVDEESPTMVWAVELSDDRSTERFFTVYRKAKEDCPKGASHRPYVFHRDRGKRAKDTLLRRLAGRRWAKQRWKSHYHVLLDGPVTLEDLEGHDIPESITTQIKEYLDGSSKSELAVAG